ncbi:nicotinate-nucleotide--dimethylbenzimidazole phosphoribosyltransferase [Streptomyces sp. NBC_01022]|uniref:nicotinate-nucleotide--dimethylbenzimidazole phosphoribosyltransferase n=1 Tax=Streptomyces sp. NBC_01022 TaxID=2903723 RepID=UPI002DD7D3D4|nr:nicotinate-nucleotide--dimethylbenzimidazole phosphoribosyltransferase [Streptomyces sp. NBC_01022]WRZ80692.1 nicotinate-nucleotide--dimethylbenzimidazole phosphoribosyltransferase [Streptomyces sp. NBC_01022]
MSDTGQIPGEGLPENAGMVEQTGIPAPDAYTFLDPSEHASEDDDLLLMPSPQGAWSEPQAGQAPLPGQGGGYEPGPVPQHMLQGDGGAQAPVPFQEQVPAYAMQQAAAQSLQESGQGTHESGGRNSGHVDLGGVRIPSPVPAPAQAQVPVTQSQSQTQAPVRRPLHRGPSAESGPSYGGTSGGVVRSLADRGPAGAPQPQAQPLMQAAVQAPARHAGPVTAEPEYFELPADEVAALPGPQLGEIPPQGVGQWAAQASPQAAVPVVDAEPSAPEVTAAETVVPEPVVAEPVAPVPVVAEPAVAEQAFPEPVAEEPVAEVQAQEPAPVEQPVEPVAVDPVAVEPVAVEPAPLVAEEPVPVPAAVGAPDEVPEEAPPAEVLAEAAPLHAAPAEAAPAEAVVPAEAVAPSEAAPAEEPVAEAVLAEAPAEEAPVDVEVAAAVQPPVEPVPDGGTLGRFVPVADTLPTAPHPAPAPVSEQQVEPAPEAVAAVTETGPAEAVETVAAVDAAAPESVVLPEPETGPEVIETPDLTDSHGYPEPAQPEAVEPEPETRAAEPVEAVVAEAPATADEPEASDAPAIEAEEVPVASPPAPGYDDAEREAVLRVMRERRDIRNGFRSDPIPHEVLLRVLEAAHTAPSVGHSQPWDFVVIRSAETRRSMHELAQHQREAYAKSLPKARAKQFKELKIEAIVDTPVNIVVTADPTRGGRHTLGRHTQPQMAPYSSALAVENLWLAARAEGLGVGWVSFFDEREMVRALGLPEHLEVVAYLCVGYVDEFPEEPELMQAGWSKRRPLSWVVHEETYGRRALPGEEPHNLLQETIAGIRPLDAKALGEAWERQKRMTKPAGALGMLEIISAQLSGLSRMCPPPIPEPAAVAIFAGDHGVHAQGVTAWPQEVTGQMVANFLGGGAVCNAFAAQVGAEVCVVDVGVAMELPAQPGLLPRKVRAGTADFTTGPALTREEVVAAIEVGIETARDLVAAGNKGLLTGEMGIANTTASAALICVYTGMDPAEVTGRGTGINDEMHARKIDVVRRALDLHQPDPADPIGVLAAVGGLEHAAMAGFLLGGASLRTPVILDGVSAGAAALVARAIAPEALAACIAGHRSAEPGHVAALNKLGLRPLVDLDLRLGEGTGALLALPIVQSAARAMHEVATFDSAGVTEK